MKARKMTISTAVGMASLMLGSAHAADAPKWYETTTVSGFVDGYYKANLDGRKSSTSSTTDKVFDVHENTFALQGGKVELSTAAATVDLYFGDYGTALQTNIGKPEVAVVGQAFITEPLGPVNVTLGRFFTHVGYEVADSVSNFNFTRGLLYGSVPFYHQGLKLNYSPVDGLGLMAMLDNGNSVNYNTSNETAGGAQISYTGVKGLALYLNYYYQPLAAWEKTHFIDAVGSYALNDKLTFAAEYLYFTSIANADTDTNGDVTGTFMVDPSNGKKIAYSPKTQGYSLYVDYATPMDGLSITPRFEALYAPDNGNAGDGLSKFDYTLTARYTKGAVINWLEWRTDAADDAVYPGAVNDPTTASYTESSLTWGIATKF